MSRRWRWLALGVGLALLGCEHATPEPSPTTRAAPSTAVPAAPALEHLEIVTGGARAEQPLPLIVAVHGLGDTPRGFASLFDGFDAAARIVLPRAPEPHGGGYSWFRYRAEIGDAELARGIDAAAERLARAIDDLARTRPTLGRPIVTGFSQGGMLSFAIAAKRPELVRAAFPVGGALPKPLWPPAEARARDTPRIVALHGEEDPLVPLEPTRRAVDALAKGGFDAELETFAGVAHSVPAPVRSRLFALLREELARK